MRVVRVHASKSDGRNASGPSDSESERFAERIPALVRPGGPDRRNEDQRRAIPRRIFRFLHGVDRSGERQAQRRLGRIVDQIGTQTSGQPLVRSDRQGQAPPMTNVGDPARQRRPNA